MLPAFADSAARSIWKLLFFRRCEPGDRVGRVGVWHSSAACTAGRAHCPRPGRDILNPFPLKLVPKSPCAHQVSLFLESYAWQVSSWNVPLRFNPCLILQKDANNFAMPLCCGKSQRCLTKSPVAFYSLTPRARCGPSQ